LRHLNPMPSDLGDLLSRFERVLVPELNSGQLSMLLRSEFTIPVKSITKVAGQPFKISELVEHIQAALRGDR